LSTHASRSASSAKQEAFQILDLLIALKTALASVERRSWGPSFDWQCVHDSVKQVRAALSDAKLLAAVVYPSENRGLGEFLDELSARYHLDSGEPVIGLPDKMIAQRVQRFIRVYAAAADNTGATADDRQATLPTGDDAGAGDAETTPVATPAGSTNNLKPSEEKAYGQYRQAMEREPKLVEDTDQIVYDWIDENLLDEGESLPSFATWRRQMGAGRKHHDDQKNTPKANRAIGRSIVRPPEI